MRTARTLSAVTATPDNGVVVGVPMSGVPRRVVAADRVVAACPNGGDVGGGVVQDVRGELHEGETEREGEEDEDEWWAGEEFEEEWACIFEAFCPEGEERRLPCLAAREVRVRLIYGPLLFCMLSVLCAWMRPSCVFSYLWSGNGNSFPASSISVASIVLTMIVKRPGEIDSSAISLSLVLFWDCVAVALPPFCGCHY